MAKRFNQSKKKKDFIDSIPCAFIESSDISQRCKFNFSYLEVNQTGTSFIDWNETGGDSKLHKLLNKVKEYTRESLRHWQEEKIGRGKRGANKRQSVLELYGDFPSHSELSHPPHVPEDVIWGRFRIDNETRLAGFVIPESFYGTNNRNFMYDTNTFYVVFLDDDHKFYPLKT